MINPGLARRYRVDHVKMLGCCAVLRRGWTLTSHYRPDGRDRTKAKGSSAAITAAWITGTLGIVGIVITGVFSGATGTRVTLSGEGYPPNARVVFRFHTTQFGETRTNGDGKFSNVSAKIPSGVWSVRPATVRRGCERVALFGHNAFYADGLTSTSRHAAYRQPPRPPTSAPDGAAPCAD
jgi:hypothetical protein